MKTVKNKIHETTTSVGCPHCDNWEELGIDDSRKNLNSLPVIKWLPDNEATNEKSIHKCTECNNEFQVEWEYRTNLNK